MTKKILHRSTPLKESFETIRSYPTTLKLYKISSSPFYWKRFYYKGKLFRESSGTSDLKIAKEKLLEYYNKILDNKYEIKNTHTKTINSFEMLGNEFMHQQQKLIDRFERNPRINSVDRSILNSSIIPFFGNKSIKKIVRVDLEDFFTHLSKDKKLKTTSIKKVLNLLKKIFKYAYESNLIDKLPFFPTISTIDSPRPSFSLNQYKTLISSSDDLIKIKKNVRGYEFREDMKYLVQFMVNSFIRPTDLKFLRHRNIVITDIFDDAKKRKCLEIYYEHGKTKTRRTTYSLEQCVNVYQKLKDFYSKNNEQVGNDDYIFFPMIKNREYALKVIQRLFNALLDKSELKYSNLNEANTLYSLRHSAISYRIYDGVDINIIARNANTSADMINRFYASHILNKMSSKDIQLRHKKKSN